VAHFHGWSASLALILLRHRNADVATVFTTHGCQLAHDLCSSCADFHNDVTDNGDFDEEATKLGIGHRYHIEKVVAGMAHVLTAVSEVSTVETKYLLKRQPDYVTYSGLDFESYFKAEQLDEYHALGKAKIHQLVRRHFNGQVNFDLKCTQYFFFVSRYKFCNEGADMFIESLARLNHKLKVTGSKETVVAFFIFPLQGGNTMVGGGENPIQQDLKRCNLLNDDGDRVKIILQPDLNFSTDNGDSLHWQEFLIGCHLSVLPSYYEPWGYTAADCITHGLPTVTTNCSGFGRFMEESDQGRCLHENGVFIVDRRYKSVEESVCQLAQWMLHLTELDHDQRSQLRSKVRCLSSSLDWEVLYNCYLQARQTAIERNRLDTFEE